MKLFARDALLPTGWARDVAIEIDDGGMIRGVDVEFAIPADAEHVSGPLVPGMPNVHSHAFQRALAGLTERGGPAADNFWMWRETMYRFLERLGPEDNEAIAAQLYVEMLKAGYTSVGEFHYLHHDPKGEPYADPGELARRIVTAAARAEIRLTLLPVFYAHADFGGKPPAAGQKRFVHTPESYCRLVAKLERDAARSGYTLGVAPHSLRAVMPEELTQVVARAPRDSPLHIHAAEQKREVDQCYAWSGRRPVQWLLENAGIDERWCIVHATHMVDSEVQALAKSRAVAGFAPTTEADLGDGMFPGDSYVAAKGRFGVGSDCNTVVDPFAELRQVEWVQRLKVCRRNVLVGEGESSGLKLWQMAAAGGAQALAQPVGAIAIGRRADFVVMNTDDPALAEQPSRNVMDAAIFGPGRRVVRDVMVAGRWVVGEGHHSDEEAILIRYRQTIKRLLA